MNHVKQETGRIARFIQAARKWLERILTTRDKGSSAQRISKTVATQIYNQVLTVAQQLLLAPLLLHTWGIETYGVWLLLSAIPNYLTLSDLGFTTIAKNEMTIRIAQEDRKGAVETYQSVFLMLLVVSLGILLLALLSLPYISVSSRFQIDSISEMTAKSVLLLLSGNFLVLQFMTLICAGFRGIGQPEREVGWSATARLGELAVTALGAFISDQIAVAAVLILISRILFTIVMYIALLRSAPYLRFGWRDATRAEIRRLLHPSFGYTMWIAAGVLLLQGPIVALGTMAGPAIVATYSTLRTLTRLGISGINVLNFSIMPEYSRLFGGQHLGKLRTLVVYHLSVSAICVVGYVVFMTLFGPSLMGWWMSGKIEATEPLFGILIATVALEMIWSAAFVAFSAIGRHVEASYAYFVVAVAGIVSIYLFAPSLGVTGVAGCVLVAQVLMLTIVAVLLPDRLLKYRI